jgi:DNA (cytosine-5)-methyltransferase 1
LKNSSPNVLDLFCGAGGLSLGFKQAGFKCIFAIDNDKKSIDTYTRNLGKHAVCGDIYDLNLEGIYSFLKSKPQIDVIVGGPPCQGFSVQRRGNDKDARNLLVLEYLRLVLEARPQVFVMENVSGLLSKRGEPVLKEFKEQVSSAGYEISIEKLDASAFGIPQRRKRVFLVGCSNKRAFKFPTPSKRYLEAPKTVRDVIFDLQDLDEHDIANHKADKLSAINIERIKSIKEGQGRDSLPEHLQLPCHRNNSNHRHLDTYGRMAWDLPASTITARFDSFSRGRFGHPVLDRTITLREGARLQTFPDNFEFIGTKVEVARQIGNAVPPLLAKKIALSVKKHMEKNQ